MEHKPIHHITHIDNLPRILEEEGLWCDNESAARECCRQSIGFDNIKDRRMRKTVQDWLGEDVSAGGVVADYVPLYFAVRSPMLYTISRGNVPSFTGSQKEIVYLVSSTKRVAASDCDWCFTNGHAVEGMSEFYADLESLDEVDWEIIKARMWNNTSEHPDRKRKKQAEFLVHRFFPWSLVFGLAVMNDEAAEKVQRMLDSSGLTPQPEIKVVRNWYY